MLRVLAYSPVNQQKRRNNEAKPLLFVVIHIFLVDYGWILRVNERSLVSWACDCPVETGDIFDDLELAEATSRHQLVSYGEVVI